MLSSLTDEAHEISDATGDNSLDSLDKFVKSTKINQLLSIMMNSDNLMPPPCSCDFVSGGDISEKRSPAKTFDKAASEKKRKSTGAPPGAASKARFTSNKNRAGGHCQEKEGLDGTSEDHSRCEPSSSKATYAPSEEAEKEHTNPLHLDDEDHEWFRTLFKSSITPREHGGGGGFGDHTMSYAGGGIVGSAFEENFSANFPFSPNSPMFRSSARLTPSRRVAPFFSPDIDIAASPAASPRPDYVHSGSNLNREFMFSEGDVPTYDSRVKELSLPAKRFKKKKSCTKVPVEETTDTSSSRDLVSHEELACNPHPVETAALGHEYGSVEAAEEGIMLPSIPACLLEAPVHGDMHMRLDPIIPTHSVSDVLINARVATADLLPSIPQGFIDASVDAPSSKSTPGNESESNANRSKTSVPATDGISTKDTEEVHASPCTPLEVSESPAAAVALKEVEEIVTKPKRKTINILVTEIITLLDMDILTNYSEGMPLDYAKNRVSRDIVDPSGSSTDPKISRQPHLNAILQFQEVLTRLTHKDIRDLNAGNLSATNISKVLGESHHRRVWEVTTMLSVLGLVEPSYQKGYMRRCNDDSQMITQLALLQNEAIFQFPRDAVANDIVPADFFKTKSSLLFKLQSSLASCTSSTQLGGTVPSGDYEHSFYYREVLKIFLCGNKVTVPDIRRVFISQGCNLSQSGERRLYDAIAVMLSAGIIKRHEDPRVYIASVSKRMYVWCFHDLKDIRQRWLQAET